MDFKRFKKFDEVISCGICLEDFDEDTRCPRILSCGHTFCHSCLEKLFPEGSLCPTCKTAFNYVSVDLVPVNFFAKSIISIKKESAMNDDLVSLTEMTNSSKNELAVKSEFEQKEFTKLRCLDCDSWACSASEALLHEHCQTVSTAVDCEDKTNQLFLKIDKELSLRETTKERLREIMNAKRREIEELNKNIHELEVMELNENEFMNKLKQLQISVEESDSDNTFIDSMVKLEIFLSQGQRKHLAYLPDVAEIKKEILKTLCSKEPCYLVINHGTDNSMYGKLECDCNDIRIYCFQSEKPPKVRFIPIKYIFPTYPEQSCLSKIVFFKLAFDPRYLMDFEIQVEINEGNDLATFFNNGTNIKGKILNQYCKGDGSKIWHHYFALADRRNSNQQREKVTTPFNCGKATGAWGLSFNEGFRIIWIEYLSNPSIRVGHDTLTAYSFSSFTVKDYGWMI